MKLEVLRLEGKFNEAQLEIRNLRGNIELLKCSYSSIVGTYDDDDDNENSQIRILAVNKPKEPVSL